MFVSSSFFLAMRPVLLCLAALLLSVDCSLLPEQKTSLIALYNATGGPFWTHTWDLLTDPCDDSWYGVSCEYYLRNSVVDLNLNINNLTGSLPDLELPDVMTMYGNPGLVSRTAH